MSEWEQAPVNALQEVFRPFHIYGCLFHYTQRVWSKVQKLCLNDGFTGNLEICKFSSLLTTIPFLHASLIVQTFNLISKSSLESIKASMVEKLKKYVKRYRLTEYHFELYPLELFRSGQRAKDRV